MTKFDKGYIEKALGIPVFAHGTLDSTSSEARRLLRDGRCAPFLVVADSQSEGRGRQGKSFLSPKGGLYMSIALPAPEKNAVSITTRACVALARAIRSLTGEDVKIKWVNDIWLGDRKVAGILTEAVGDENGNVYSVIIGIGVNLFGFSIIQNAVHLCGFWFFGFFGFLDNVDFHCWKILIFNIFINIIPLKH